MESRITYSLLYRILFFLCIGVPYLNNYELTFAVWLLAVSITLSKSYSVGFLKYLGLFVAIIGIAVLVGLTKSHPIYYVVRDITYMAKPIMGLMIGYQLCKRTFSKGFETIVITGLIIASIHLIVLVLAVVLHNARTVNDLRLYGGYFSDFEIFALIILIFHDRFDLSFTRKNRLLFTYIIGFSAFMYLARTNFLQFFILFFAMKGYFRITPRSVVVVSASLLVVVLAYSAIVVSNPKRNGPGMEAFLYKIKIAPTEPFKTKIDVDDWRDFNDNYRSYENINTVRQMTAHGTTAVLFGEGIGSRVDLKKEVMLGDMMLRYISILHNGFMTVFLKSGLAGVFIYLYSIYLLIRPRKSKKPLLRQVNLLLVGTGIFLILSNWVFMGVYNLLDSKSILIGFLLCYKQLYENQATNPISNE